MLDAAGIEAWFLGAARELAATAEIVAIVPVAHGAAAALITDGKLAAPVMDYEDAPPPDIISAYDRERDGFELTLSPRLPQGLNLGQQLFWKERLMPWPGRVRALLWPQYWAWRLCGETASEITSLGCHTDLWRPYQARFSALAIRRGWDDRLPVIRRAAEVLLAHLANQLRVGVAEVLQLPLVFGVLPRSHSSR